MQEAVSIDVHAHLAGSGCCDSGCYLSPAFQKRYTFVAIKLMHRISQAQMRSSIDRDWAIKVSSTLAKSPLQYGVVLGLDGVYPNGSVSADPLLSQMIIPEDWVFRVCQTHTNLLPGPSINPNRKDAVSALERCLELGAVLIKWLPSVQLIDASAKHLETFYRVAARAKIPLLVHMGGERTFRSLDPKLNEVHRLRHALDLGVTVICAHTATRVMAGEEPDQLDELRELLRTYPQLWVDNSGLCNPSRFFHVPGLAKDPLITSRTLYGSDFPVPSNAFYYVRELGLRKVVAIERERNVITRDVVVKRALGYPDETLTRASKVLINLDRWVKRR